MEITNDTPLSYLTVGQLRQIFREEKVNEAELFSAKPEVFNTFQVANLKGVRPDTVNRWERTGRLKAHSKGRGKRMSTFHIDDVNKL